MLKNCVFENFVLILKKIIVMKSILLLFCTVSFVSFGNNLKPETSSNSENHLLEVNNNWNSWNDRMSSEIIGFESEIDRIQYHLFHVVDLLRENSINYVGKSLENREFLIQSLEGYAENGIFPTNHYHSERRPYFVDNYGVHCAVGYLMAVSGHEELVQRIQKEHNFDYLKDITTKGVTEWAQEFGFSLEELKLIQPAYPASSSLVAVGEGTNGEVKEMVQSSAEGSLIFGGDFSTVNNLPCANIGVFQNNQLSCFNGGVDGTLNDLYIHFSSNQESIYAVGDFTNQGDNFPVVRFVNGQKEFISIPERPDAIGLSIAWSGNWQIGAIYVAIRENESAQDSEVWMMNSDGVWSQKFEVQGVFTDIVRTGGRVAYIGSFDEVEVFDGNSSEDLLTDNVFIVNDYEETIETYQSQNISDTVFALKQVGGVLYLAGSCANGSGVSDACLTRITNGQFQKLITPDNFMGWGQPNYDSPAIKSMHIDPTGMDGSIYIAGRFNINTGMYSGRNFAKFNTLSNGISPIDVLNGEVHSLSFYQGKMYLGGNFPSSIYGDLNYIASYESNLASVDNIENSSISVYPNPFSQELVIDGVAVNSTFEIVQMNGQVVRKGEILNGKIDQLDDLSKGVYLLKVQSEGVEKTIRITK